MSQAPPSEHRSSWPARRANEVALAVAFLTRLPTPGADWRVPLMTAAWAFPLAGALAGGLAGAVAEGLFAAGLGPLLAAGLAVGASVLLTGALHEDGLADTADGIGSGRDRLRSLEILRDSRIGTYGVVAVVLSLLIRVAALAPLLSAAGGPGVAALAWALAGAQGRAGGVLFARLCPPARTDGLGAEAGRPSRPRVGGALALPLSAALAWDLLAGRPPLMPVLLIAGLLPLLWLGRLALRRLGGQTGDVLGAAMLSVEVAVLVLLAAVLT